MLFPFQSHTHFKMIISKKKIEKKIPALSQNVPGLAPMSNSLWFWTLKVCSLYNDPTQSLVSKGELKINNLMVGKCTWMEVSRTWIRFLITAKVLWVKCCHYLGNSEHQDFNSLSSIHKARRVRWDAETFCIRIYQVFGSLN